MTSERKRAILIVILTLLVGIIIGSLATGMMARQHYNGSRNELRNNRSENQMGFLKKIITVTDADKEQETTMKPILERTIGRLDSLQENSSRKAQEQMDAMLLELEPILRKDQLEKLKEFGERIKSHGRHRNHK